MTIRTRILLLLCAVFRSTFGENACPTDCLCAQTNDSRWIVNCDNAGFVCIGSRKKSNSCPDGKVLQLRNFPGNTFNLSLRGNRLDRIGKSTFATLPILELLDLSDNRIEVASNAAFQSLTELRSLNLSGNQLQTVTKNLFSGLKKLERLDLSNNPLPVIPPKALKDLKALEYLNIASNHLTCDCNIRWLKKFLRRKKIELGPDTRCRFPKSLRGTPLLRVKNSDLSCPETLNPSLFEIEPSDMTRLVFPGDSIAFRCKLGQASKTGLVSLEWLHNNIPVVKNLSKDGRIKVRFDEEVNADAVSILTASVQLEKIGKEDEGVWECRAEAPDRGPIRKMVRLIVMAGKPLSLPSTSTEHMQKDSGHCAAESVNSDGKGIFHWPKTPAGEIAKLPCAHGTETALRECSKTGDWSPYVNVESCDFASELVRRVRLEILEATEVSRSSRWASMDNITEEALSQASELSTSELDFLLQGLESIGHAVTVEDSKSMLASIARIAELMPESVLASQRLRKLLDSYRQLDETRSSAVYAEPGVEPIGFCEIPSVSLADRKRVGGVNAFIWNTSSPAMNCGTYRVTPGKVAAFGASVTVPRGLIESIIRTIPNGRHTASLFAKVRFFWTNRTAAIFSATGNGSWYPDNGVLGVQMEDLLAGLGRTGIFARVNTPPAALVSEASSPTEEVTLTFYVKTLSSILELGVWSETEQSWTRLNEFGTASGCRVSSSDPDPGQSGYATFKCPGDLIALVFNAIPSTAFVYFTPLQERVELERLNRSPEPISLPPWMYAGTGSLSFCILFSVLVYVCCRDCAKISVKLRHCLLNAWIAITLLSLVFTLGINQKQSELRGLCFAVSLLLHYLTLSAFFWLLLTARTLQRKGWKIAHPKTRREDDEEVTPPSELPKHGALAGLYFLAWGIPLLLAAFTLALKMEEYSKSRTLCFIHLDYPALGALVIPTALIVFATLSLFLTAACQGGKETRRRGDESSQLLVLNKSSNGLSPAITRCPADADEATVVSAQSSVVDQDRKSSVQLRLLATLLALFLLSYASAVLYVWRPAPIGLPYWNLLTSGLYTALLSGLGLFVFYGYVWSRPGVLPRCCWTRPEEASAAVRSPSEHSYRRNVGVGGPDYVRSNAETIMTSPYRDEEETGIFLLAPEKQRRMLHIARKYHSKQRKQQNQSANYDAYDLQSEVIPEEEEDEVRVSRSSSSKQQQIHPSARLYSSTLVASFYSDPGANRKKSRKQHPVPTLPLPRASSHSPMPTQDIFDEDYQLTTTVVDIARSSTSTQSHSETVV